VARYRNSLMRPEDLENLSDEKKLQYFLRHRANVKPLFLIFLFAYSLTSPSRTDHDWGIPSLVRTHDDHGVPPATDFQPRQSKEYLHGDDSEALNRFSERMERAKKLIERAKMQTRKEQ